jgi:hypothetical protein
MTNPYNRFSDKAIRSKNLDKMNEAEKALLEIEVERALDSLKSKYRGEGNTMLELSKRLREEAGRLLYSETNSNRKPSKEAPVSYGGSLFEEDHR